MSEVWSLAEIKARCVYEWVLIQNPQTTETLELICGIVVWHSKDRDEVYRKARELNLQRLAILYTGEVPKDTAVVL